MKYNTKLKYPDRESIRFDRYIKTRDSWVGGVGALQISQERAYVNLQRTLCVNEHHKELGHPSEKTTGETAELFEIKVVGTFKPHEYCDLPKAR